MKQCCLLIYCMTRLSNLDCHQSFFYKFKIPSGYIPLTLLIFVLLYCDQELNMEFAMKLGTDVSPSVIPLTSVNKLTR